MPPLHPRLAAVSAGPTLDDLGERGVHAAVLADRPAGQDVRVHVPLPRIDGSGHGREGRRRQVAATNADDREALGDDAGTEARANDGDGLHARADIVGLGQVGGLADEAAAEDGQTMEQARARAQRVTARAVAADVPCPGGGGRAQALQQPRRLAAEVGRGPWRPRREAAYRNPAATRQCRRDTRRLWRRWRSSGSEAPAKRRHGGGHGDGQQVP